MNFDAAFDRLLLHEGEFTNDPRDAGNWTGGKRGEGRLRGTKYGISAAAYPEEDIAAVTIVRARELYRRDYWGKAGCDALPALVRFHVFDAAVNSGPRKAIEWLQAAVHETVDGIIGPRTLQAVQSTPELRIVARINGYRLDHMTQAWNWPTYSRGWVARVAANLKAT